MLILADQRRIAKYHVAIALIDPKECPEVQKSTLSAIRQQDKISDIKYLAVCDVAGPMFLYEDNKCIIRSISEFDSNRHWAFDSVYGGTSSLLFDMS